MLIPGENSDMAKPSTGGLRELVRKRWRAWLRAVHRDFGYLAVGLTMIYAFSGIAINHIGSCSKKELTRYYCL